MTIYKTSSEDETFELGKKLACKARPGQIIALNGDLGSGKTVFTKGFASGLGITEPVTSPTFTIVQEYDTGRLNLYHFDVYRIGSVGEIYETGLDEYLFGEGVSIVEWAEKIDEILPGDAVRVSIRADDLLNPNRRVIEITEKNDL